MSSDVNFLLFTFSSNFFPIVIRFYLILKNNHRPKKKNVYAKTQLQNWRANPIPREYFSEVDLRYKWKQPNSYWHTQSKNLLLYITNQDWDQAVRHLYIQLQVLLLNPSKNDGIATTLIRSFLAYYQQRNPMGGEGNWWSSFQQLKINKSRNCPT